MSNFSATPVAHQPTSQASVEEPASLGGRFEIIDDRIRQNESEDDMDDTDSMTMSESTRSLSLASNNENGVLKSRFVRQETGGSTHTAVAYEGLPPLKAIPTEVLERFENKENRSEHIPHAMSRFKLVHVDARFHRGRWKCWDYMEDEKPAEAEQAEIDLEKPKSTLLAKEAEEKAGAVKFSVGDTIDEERMPKYAQQTSQNEALNRTQVAQASNSDWLINYLMPGRNPSASMSPAINSNEDSPWHGKDVAMPVASQSDPSAELSVQTNEQNLDSKIQQAMDLVKTHLMFAVHEEVNSLRAQLAELRAKEQRLVMENTLLRSHATPETLTKLDELSKHADILSSMAGTASDDANRQRSHTISEHKM